MKCLSSCLLVLLILISMKQITARQNFPTKLISIDETQIFRALTVIEGDILVDKYCECQPERDCRNMKRSVIKLTK